MGTEDTPVGYIPDILAGVRTFEGLDTAARIDRIMAMSQRDRDVLGWALLLETHERLDQIEGRIHVLQSRRTWLDRATYAGSALVGVLAGLLGLPHIPTP